MLCQGGRPSAISNYVVGWELLESSQCSRVSMLRSKKNGSSIAQRLRLTLRLQTGQPLHPSVNEQNNWSPTLIAPAADKAQCPALPLASAGAAMHSPPHLCHYRKGSWTCQTLHNSHRSLASCAATAKSLLFSASHNC